MGSYRTPYADEFKDIPGPLVIGRRATWVACVQSQALLESSRASLCQTQYSVLKGQCQELMLFHAHGRYQD